LSVDEVFFSGHGTVSALTCDKTELAPAAKATCTATYTLDQVDVDAGVVDNTAVAHGKADTDNNPNTPDEDVVSNTDDAQVIVELKPDIEVVKTATTAGGKVTQVGQVVDYTFTVTNTGNTTLTNVTLTDPLPGLSTPTVNADGWPGTAAGVLKPGEKVIFTASLTVDQVRFDAGSILNTATTKGECDGCGEPAEDDDDESVEVEQHPAIDLVKTAETFDAGTSTPTDLAKTLSAVGDYAVYTFTITNTGDVTLHDVTLSDDMLAGYGVTPDCVWTGAPELAPGESTTCTATLTATQAVKDSPYGELPNTAVAVGTPPDPDPTDYDDPEPVTDEDDEIVEVVQNPEIELGKEGRRFTEKGVVKIEYSFTVTNTGDVTLKVTKINDPKLGGDILIPDSAWNFPGAIVGVLPPGKSISFVASQNIYTVTAQDRITGYAYNKATVEGIPPSEDPVDDDDDEEIPVPGTAAIQLTKTVAAPPEAKVGDVLNYTFVVKNTGQVRLTSVTVTDPLPGMSSITFGNWPGPDGQLDPGQTVTATATYVVKQADIDAGGVWNTATTYGTPPDYTPDDGIDPDPVTDEDDADVPLYPPGQYPEGNPKIKVVKGAELDESPVIGQPVRYTFTVTNIGDQPLRHIELSDALVGISEITFGAWPGEEDLLLPGQSVAATATYALTSSDFRAGKVDNKVTVVGTSDPDNDGDTSDGRNVTDDDKQTVYLEDSPLIGGHDTPAIDVVKMYDHTGSPFHLGDTIKFSFLVRNIGDLPLTDVTLADKLPGVTTPVFGAWPGAAGELLPGESVTATATYVVTAADVTAGQVYNQVTATGIPDDGDPDTEDEPVTDDSDVTPKVSAPKLALAKDVTPSSDAAVGESVLYSFTVTNTGNVPVKAISITEVAFSGTGVLGQITCPAGAARLIPGASLTCTATYTVTQADVDAGKVTNTAKANGTAETDERDKTEPVESNVDDAELTTTTARNPVRETATPTPIPNITETPRATEKVETPEPTDDPDDPDDPDDSGNPVIVTGGDVAGGLPGLAPIALLAGAMLAVAARLRSRGK
jgi:uncharacterized repeat protein (TIGR01451 family)